MWGVFILRSSILYQAWKLDPSLFILNHPRGRIPFSPQDFQVILGTDVP